MYFKIGYSVRPKEVNNLSQVIYERFKPAGRRGQLEDILPTSDECTAYGFVFKASDSKCYIVENNLRFNYPKPTDNLSINKASNFIGRNTRDNIISGASHILHSNNYSNIISGDNNTLRDLVSYTTISGTRAEATVDNSTVLGGNQPTDILAERQLTTLMYGKRTTNGNTTASNLNNLSANYFVIQDNTAVYFHAEAIAVRVGGTGAGTIGDYSSFVQRGVVINKSGVLSVNSERDNIKSSGTVSSWRTSGNVSGTNFYIGVRGAANVNIEWSISIRLTEMRTGVTL